MESDGRIRSKDIGTGEVNSRALDNIRSSNYDGSHTDPETNPGENGWQILKNGISVFNNAIIRGTLTAGKLISGAFNVTSGGSMTFGPEAAPLMTLDEDGARIGTDVVIDATGLWVDGGLVPASWYFRDSDSAQNVSLTTTMATHVSVVITPPAWVQQLNIRTSLAFQMTASASHNMHFRIDANGSPGTGQFVNTVVSGATQHVTRARSFAITSFPATINGVVAVNSGTNSSNVLRLDVDAVGIRI